MNDVIPAVFFRQAERLSQKPLFYAKRSGAFQPITWEQAAGSAEKLASCLIAGQVAPGDRVLLLSENRPEWGIADIAIQSIGAWTVPIYPTLPADAVRLIASDCRPAAAIVSNAEQLAKMLSVCQTQGCIRTVIVMDDCPLPAPGTSGSVLAWRTAEEQGAAALSGNRAEIVARRGQLKPDDTATLIYTSGTTGEPKGVMLSHRNFLSNVSACREILSIQPSDTHLSFLPLSHVFERMAGWYLMLTSGASVAFAESMDSVAEDMQLVRPTIMLGVPRFFEKFHGRIQEAIRKSPPARQRLITWALGVGRATAPYRLAGKGLPPALRLKDRLAQLLVLKKLRLRLGGRLRFFVSGSAPLAKELADFFYSTGITILEGYGLTETSPVIAVNRLEHPRFGSVGQAIPGVLIRIAEDGEILSKGPHIMQGYYQRPQDTTAAVVDGWFHTGDIGRMDPEGYLYITDRKKDLIKTAGGKFVAPQKLEGLFSTDPFISQVFIYGDKKPYCIALIVPNRERLTELARERGLNASDLSTVVRDPGIQRFYWARIEQRQQSLAPYEQIKRIVLIDREFTQASGELTPTMKAKRRAITDNYQQLLDQVYLQDLPR